MPGARKIFIPFCPLDDRAARAAEGADVFFTAAAPEDFAAAEASLKATACSCAGTLTQDATLESIAPAVIEAAEKLGGIDSLIFAPSLAAKEEVFLDLTAEDFAAHASALTALFCLCKCALPYLTGGSEPEIVIVLPQEPENLTSKMYRAAVAAMSQSMSAEFAEYGIKVKVTE